MSSSSVIQGLSLNRRLMATTNQLTTYDVTQTQKQNLPLTSPATFSTLDALNQAWLYAGEQFIYTAHSCGYGFSASTCGNCQNGACFDLKSGGPCVAQVVYIYIYSLVSLQFFLCSTIPAMVMASPPWFKLPSTTQPHRSSASLPLTVLALPNWRYSVSISLFIYLCVYPRIHILNHIL